ncbi:hypothetical protein [Providencia rettgeri]|uniref:hypothetical protein n=1 Tax=Providencia rettgeri TaxID=587 RepID=UPI0005B52857|nr:hypothetical protein [Providencia rettgeri]
MNKSIGIGFISRILAVGSNLIIMPVILHILTPQQFSLWMLFISFYSCIIILDFGFSATTSRFYSYIDSGASKLALIKAHLRKEISKKNTHNAQHIDQRLYNALDKINSHIFSFITIIATFFFSIVYLIYIYVLNHPLNIEEKLSWFIFSLSIVILIYSLKFNGLLHGSGNVSYIYQSNIISNLSFLLLSIIFLYFDFKILGLCLARLASSIIYFLVIFNYNKKTLLQKKIKKEKSIDLLLNKIILASALKLGFGSIGNFLANRTTIFILTALFPLSTIAGDTFVINICITLLSISLIINNNYLPKMSNCRMMNDHQGLIILIKENFIKSIITYLILFLIFYTLAPLALNLINSKTELPNSNIILMLGFIFFCELIQSVSISVLTTNNQLNFSKYQIVFGFMFIASVFIFYFLFKDKLSVLSILLLQLSIQLIFNNWYWFFRVFKDVKELRVNSHEKV